MPFRGITATIFADEAPRISFEDGLFFVAFGTGDSAMRYCMLPHVFLNAARQSIAAQELFRAGCGRNPVQIKAVSEH